MPLAPVVSVPLLSGAGFCRQYLERDSGTAIASEMMPQLSQARLSQL